jgi:hypothetical protein
LADEVPATEDFDFIETTTQFACDYGFELVGGKCEKTCEVRKLCGKNTFCEDKGSTYCYCKRGFAGDPIGGCFKLNEVSPCEPNPCGDGATCIAVHEIGPHCRCLPEFFGWPPNCKAGCSSNEKCADDEICDLVSHSCKKICDPSPCGENSKCRVDKIATIARCSCIDGFIPQNGLGCRKKFSNDTEIQVENIANAVNDPCEEKCVENAYCGAEKKCVCNQGYLGDPLKKCELDENPSVKDPCHPNPCGGYATCKVVEGKKNCTCVDGYGSAPYCFPCISSTACGGVNMQCVGGKCVENVCSSYCGKNSDCHIHNGTLECSCQNFKFPGNPFDECYPFHYISPATIAALAG